MGPLRGDGNSLITLLLHLFECREDGSPSWGRKLSFSILSAVAFVPVEKMGPLRGDGNLNLAKGLLYLLLVEKMGPLRGDGNSRPQRAFLYLIHLCREDGSPSWGRKLIFLFFIFSHHIICREDGSPSWGRKLFYNFLLV